MSTPFLSPTSTPNHTKTIQTLKRWLQQHLGYAVPVGHVIHHIDHNPRHNSVRNLLVLTPREHGCLHWATRRDARLKTPTHALRWLAAVRHNPRRIAQAWQSLVRSPYPHDWSHCPACQQPIVYEQTRITINDPLAQGKRRSWHLACWPLALK